MDPHLNPALEDLVRALPANARQHRRRMRLARVAVLRVAPHLASGLAADVRPEDLRTLFIALDLFLFGSRYRTAFEDAEPAALVWCLDEADHGPAGRLEQVPACETSDVPDEPTLLEFHVAPARLVLDGAGDGRHAFLNRLAHTILGLMILAAASFVEDDVAAALRTAGRLVDRLPSGCGAMSFPAVLRGRA